MGKEKSFAILPGAVKDGSVLRGRDVEFELKGKNVDPAVVSLLIRLAEINHVNTKANAELAQMLDKVVDMFVEFVNVADNMKEQSQRLLREAKGADVDDTDHTDTRN